MLSRFDAIGAFGDGHKSQKDEYAEADRHCLLRHEVSKIREVIATTHLYPAPQYNQWTCRATTLLFSRLQKHWQAKQKNTAKIRQDDV